jgi:acyl carrier protein
MDTATIEATLSEIMREVLDDPSITLSADTVATDVPGWDSMTNITFVVEVERRFGVKFKTAEIEEMHNVGDMVKMIRAKKGL